MDFMNKSKAIEMSTKTSKIEVIVPSKTVLENCMPSILLGLMKSAGNWIAEKKKQIDNLAVANGKFCIPVYRRASSAGKQGSGRGLLIRCWRWISNKLAYSSYLLPKSSGPAWTIASDFAAESDSSCESRLANDFEVVIFVLNSIYQQGTVIPLSSRVLTL